MNVVHDKTVIIILGPTAAGKTGLSLMLAQALQTEIISADSMQVYRHMDIGTAKPSADELKKVPHHLINIMSPSEPFSAGLFREKASEIIDNLHAGNRVPIIAGGTGLYIRSLTGGLFEGGGADETLRDRLKEKEKVQGKGALYHRLKILDPVAAERIGPNDLRRTIRAIEVATNERRAISGMQKKMTVPSDYNFIKIGLSRNRPELYRIIEERVDRMVSEGLLDETRQLLKMGPYRTAMQALGYKEMKLYLDGGAGLEEAVRLIKKRTRNYAKRQFTWFRKEPGVRWVDITGLMSAETIFEKVINDIDIMKKLIYSIKT